ncbi:MAG: invasion protein, partial [Hyphomicrobium sp.]
MANAVLRAGGKALISAVAIAAAMAAAPVWVQAAEKEVQVTPKKVPAAAGKTAAAAAAAPKSA